MPISSIRLSGWLHRRLTTSVLPINHAYNRRATPLRLPTQLVQDVGISGLRQSTSPSSFTSTPEVRALPSTRVTRFRRYHDPFRRPDGPPSLPATFAGRDPRDHPGPPPLTQTTFLACCAPYPGGSTGADGCSIARSRAGFFPVDSAFPAHAPGRRPHCRFRGLLELHTRYGLQGRSPT